MDDLLRDIEDLRDAWQAKIKKQPYALRESEYSYWQGRSDSLVELTDLLLKHAKAAASANPEARHDAINLALDRIAHLTVSGAFHGYRSEVWRAVAAVYDAAATAVHGTPCPGTLRPYDRRTGGAR